MRVVARSPTKPASLPHGRTAAAVTAAADAALAAAAGEEAYAAVAHLRERNVDPVFLGRLVELSTDLESTLGRAREAAVRLEEPLAARIAIGTERAGELLRL